MAGTALWLCERGAGTAMGIVATTAMRSRFTARTNSVFIGGHLRFATAEVGMCYWLLSQEMATRLFFLALTALTAGWHHACLVAFDVKAGESESKKKGIHHATLSLHPYLRPGNHDAPTGRTVQPKRTTGKGSAWVAQLREPV